MNKKQIKEELRRSACEDKDPFGEVGDWAFYTMDDFTCHGEWTTDMSDKDLRTFFLLVAEAL